MHVLAEPAPPGTGDERPDDRTLEALPVVLELAGPAAGRITAWIEGVLGWQPVAGDGVDLAPATRLIDAASAAAAAEVAGGAEVAGAAALPTVLLVTEADTSVGVAAAAVRARPAAVLAWPEERSELPDVVHRLLARAAPRVGTRDELRVGGACGGVGTTTVSLALATLSAWRAGPVLAVTHGAVPLALPRTVTVDGLAGPRAWADAHPVASIPALRVIRADRPAVDVAVDAQGATVVRDLGVEDDVDVLCVRRDAAGVAAVERSAAAAIVVLDDGLAPEGALRGAAGGRRLVTVPRSTRVARAGLLRQVPSALPGSYLRTLSAVLGGVAGRGGR